MNLVAIPVMNNTHPVSTITGIGRTLLVCLFLFVFSSFTSAAEPTRIGLAEPAAVAQQKKYPELHGEFFSDDANLLDLTSRGQISRDMRTIMKDSKIHVVLAVIKKMSDYPELEQNIQKFAEDLAEHWKVGEAKSKQGILVLFSVDDRKFYVAKTKEMSTRLTDEIKEGMMGLPRRALQQGNVALGMKRATSVLVELVPSYDSDIGVKNIVSDPGAKKATTQKRQPTSQKPPPTRVIRREPINNAGGGNAGGGIAALVCVGIAVLLIVVALGGVGMAASRGFGGGGYYGGPGYHGGGGFFSGMLTGGLLSSMFGGSNHGWGGGYHHEEHHHHYDHGGGNAGYGDGGGYDGGGFDGGGYDYEAESFGGGDFDGGSMGEW